MTKTRIRLMEVCGTHTMAIARSGIRRLLPDVIELISGPGCPVCVTSQGDIDKAIEIASLEDVIIATFGDMMRVPGSKMSLEEAKRHGSDVRVIYSCLDALNIACDNPKRKIVFIGVGFETTSPTAAATIRQAERMNIKNFFVLSDFKIIFPALDVIASSGRIRIDGFICPGHVSVITGSTPYEEFVSRHKKPCVITGFEEIDILKGIKRLIEQFKTNTHRVEIEYKRAVTKEGNKQAREVLYSVFEAKDSNWRGLGMIKNSGLGFRKQYIWFDAERRFNIKVETQAISKGCVCGEVLQGIKSPEECKLFRKVCTPQNPIGPCMVSSEGTCSAYYKYSQ